MLCVVILACLAVATSAALADDIFMNHINLGHFANAVDGPYEELAQKCYDHNMANEMDEALPYSEALVRMDPANAMHHYHLARNYLLLNQLVNALFHYNWVICCP
jgi:hypothetical protein